MARKKKHQGHYCRVCGRYRANEKFGGKGHARHICKDCAREQKAAARQRRREKLAREQATQAANQDNTSDPQNQAGRIQTPDDTQQAFSLGLLASAPDGQNVE